MNKKKILLVSETMSGGVRKHLLDIIENINTEKYDISLIYSKKRADKIFIDNLNKTKEICTNLIEVNEMTRDISLFKDIEAVLKIVKIIKRIDPHIIHFHSSKAGAIGRVATLITGYDNVIYTPHAYSFQNPELNWIKKKIYILIERFFGRFTDITINVSEGENKFSETIINKKKSIVVYNGIKDYSNKRHIKSKKEIIVGNIARLDSQKDPITFIEIAKQVVSEFSDINFWLIGDGEYKDFIRKYIRLNGLEKNVKLYDYDGNVEMYLNKFTIFMSTSLYEGFPYSLLEALSFKLPIIATNVTGNNEIVINKYNGLLFNSKDVEGGVNRIKELLLDKKVIDFYSENSYKLFLERFTLNKMIIDIEKIYDGLIVKNAKK